MNIVIDADAVRSALVEVGRADLAARANFTAAVISFAFAVDDSDRVIIESAVWQGLWWSA